MCYEVSAYFYDIVFVVGVPYVPLSWFSFRHTDCEYPHSVCSVPLMFLMVSFYEQMFLILIKSTLSLFQWLTILTSLLLSFC